MPAFSTCRVCNRKLTNPTSVAVSMGPVCAKRFGVIFEKALAYATSIGAQLDANRLQIHAAIAAQEAYRQRLSRRRAGGDNNDLQNSPQVSIDRTVSNVWSQARGQTEDCRVEFSDEHHGRVSSASGHTYDVTPASCTCLHFQHRLRFTGGTCRHIDAFNAARRDIEFTVPREVQVDPTIRSIVDQSRHEDALRSFATSDWLIEEERESVLDQWRQSRGFDGVLVHEDDEAWDDLERRAKQEWDYQYDNVLGNTGNSFGMEVEFTFPRNVSASEVARALYEEGLLDRPDYHAYHMGSAGPGYWKLETDISIEPRGLELVSPILYDRPETWQQIERACTRLKELGCSVNDSCGGHVHIGIAPMDHRTHAWQRLARIGVAYEKSIYRIGGADADGYRQTGQAGRHRGTDYAAPLPSSARQINALEPAALARQRLSSSRYTLFNTTNIDDSYQPRPAIEMRYPNSTLDHRQWQAQIQVANALVHQAAVIQKSSRQSALTPAFNQVDDHLRRSDDCSADMEVDHFRKFADVLGNDRDRLAAAWLFERGRS
ncbi:amidoligase family protein [Paenibacillus sp. LHD-117]|uniref:amidoligase family protein n=1 Tax=Paenibacillus sp. LHD-117 TaxID=3071412 RepID=UPI0027E1EC81|nr:amidoligase family protein [Paenibacillus sp. LHD-117]MDQ6422593.1 amidoligase family protein [Paenibacillus sp. LHD-117]